MRTVALIVLFCVTGQAQVISTKVLTPDQPIRIGLSTHLTTTLIFPSEISGTFGLGLGTAVQLEHPQGSNVLVFHALTDSAHVLATVLLEGKLYVFDLESTPNPEVAVTLTKSDSKTPRATEVTKEEIVKARPKYDAELLVGLLREARDADLLKASAPDLYKGYSRRNVSFQSDSGTLKTIIKEVHRFSDSDAIVLRGTILNETEKAISFDGRTASVGVANEIHPVKLLDSIHQIPPGKTVPVDCVIQGDIDGGRANLSIENEFRLYLGNTSVWSLKNGVTPKEGFKVPAPANPTAIPLTQTKALHD